jgi:hypothetical protein
MTTRGHAREFASHFAFSARTHSSASRHGGGTVLSESPFARAVTDACESRFVRRGVAHKRMRECHNSGAQSIVV